VGEEGLHSSVRFHPARWVAGLACAALRDHPFLARRDRTILAPILRHHWDAAAEAADLCSTLDRERRQAVGGPALATQNPLRPWLSAALDRKPMQPILTEQGLRLEWLPHALTRLSASSLRADFRVNGQRRQAELSCRLGYWQSLPRGVTGRPDSAPMRRLFERICGQLELLPQTIGSAGRGQALLFDPPVNVRQKPNGGVICLLQQSREITILAQEHDWLRTDACMNQDGRPGGIHRSLVRL